MKAVYITDNGRLLCGDVLEVLKTFPDDHVQCVITSPPYWGLRDYGVEGQIGLEKTPEEYVGKIVEVFREIRRVLKKGGTCWLNLGDSYAGGGAVSQKQTDNDIRYSTVGNAKAKVQRRAGTVVNLKPKNLIGIPWRVAFALQSDGWYLRQDIIWHKPNPMPESVTDRCTKAHEYVFLLTKSGKYYYNADAIKEQLQESSIRRNQTGWNGNEDRGFVGGAQNHMSKYLGSDKAKNETHRNKRSVWTVSTQPYKEAHFATFPEKLIEPMIFAGTQEKDTILDPFMGSGTVAYMCERYDRQWVGIELSKEYCKLATKRIEQESNQKKNI